MCFNKWKELLISAIWLISNISSTQPKSWILVQSINRIQLCFLKMHYQLTTHQSSSPAMIHFLCFKCTLTLPSKDFKKITKWAKASNQGAKKQSAKPNPPSSQNELNLNNFRQDGFDITGFSIVDYKNFKVVKQILCSKRKSFSLQVFEFTEFLN